MRDLWPLRHIEIDQKSWKIEGGSEGGRRPSERGSREEPSSIEIHLSLVFSTYPLSISPTPCVFHQPHQYFTYPLSISPNPRVFHLPWMIYTYPLNSSPTGKRQYQHDSQQTRSISPTGNRQNEPSSESRRSISPRLNMRNTQKFNILLESTGYLID